MSHDRSAAGPPPDAQAFIAENQGLWDEWTAIHETSAFYDLDGFRKGGIRLRPYELEDVGSVGKANTDNLYRYDDNAIYRVDRRSGLIEDIISVLGL